MLLTDLIATLQFSIGPVILISGVGLILLSLTNRLGHIVDRARILSKELCDASDDNRKRILAELRIFSRRANITRASIALLVISVLSAAILVITLFMGALMQIGIAGFVVTLFILCMLSLVCSLILFLYDIELSLKALWLEIPPEGRSGA